MGPLDTPTLDAALELARFYFLQIDASHDADENRLQTKSHSTAMDLHHPLMREFPDHRDVILRLKVGDDHFRKLFDEYHQTDDAVYRIEEQIDFASDQEFEELRMKRALLKDQLYHAVLKASPPPKRPSAT